ncbi:MAG: ABC transporter ATP-binding protein [Planctomycetes bacterium]|nr:ABC transporter ATP-binding protein [Planctomycetota bacterium]
MNLVELRGVTHRFGERTALAGLDLDIRRGEVLGLLGPNGAGKTTTLRILCGLLAPTEGSIVIDGLDVRAQPVEARRRFAFVPDGAPLYANLSPRQHMALVGRLHGVPEERIASEGRRLLDALELGARTDDPVGTFSRGMRQKTALACALLPRPPLLILDEPLNGLDAPTTAVFKDVLRTWADRGGSVLYTSHLLDVAERVCDRLAVLEGGRLVASGTLPELRTQAGRDGTLEQVFGVLTHSADPHEQALRLLG